MDTTDNTPATTNAPGTVPMARIDGAGVRRLRESKGLTQLYLATFIGVTTDTISRWEHRRYPTIKLDNAEKLAQALEVELAAILELTPSHCPAAMDDQETDSAEPPPPMSTPLVQTDIPATPAASHRRAVRPWPLLILVIIPVVLTWWWSFPAPPAMNVAAQRILPEHIPAGQAFPVLIRVTTSQQGPVALILKETIPPGCVVVNAEPPLTSDTAKSGILKWVSHTDQQQALFAYLLRAPAKAVDDDQLTFNGGITLNQGDQPQAEVGGATTMTIAPYHWADVDRDHRINDDEILAVYDRYSSLAQLDYDRDLIDAIWNGNGYGWERKTRRYVVEK